MRKPNIIYLLADDWGYGDVSCLNPESKIPTPHTDSGQFAIRKDEWKLVECRGSGGWSLREDDVPEDAPPMQLCDMANDPGEQNNLYHEKPEIVAELQGLLNGYREGDRSTT